MIVSVIGRSVIGGEGRSRGVEVVGVGIGRVGVGVGVLVMRKLIIGSGGVISLLHR